MDAAFLSSLLAGAGAGGDRVLTAETLRVPCFGWFTCTLRSAVKDVRIPAVLMWREATGGFGIQRKLCYRLLEQKGMPLRNNIVHGMSLLRQALNPVYRLSYSNTNRYVFAVAPEARYDFKQGQPAKTDPGRNLQEDYEPTAFVLPYMAPATARQLGATIQDQQDLYRDLVMNYCSAHSATCQVPRKRPTFIVNRTTPGSKGQRLWQFALQQGWQDIDVFLQYVLDATYQNYANANQAERGDPRVLELPTARPELDNQNRTTRNEIAMLEDYISRKYAGQIRDIQFSNDPNISSIGQHLRRPDFPLPWFSRRQGLQGARGAAFPSGRLGLPRSTELRGGRQGRPPPPPYVYPEEQKREREGKGDEYWELEGFGEGEPGASPSFGLEPGQPPSPSPNVVTPTEVATSPLSAFVLPSLPTYPYQQPQPPPSIGLPFQLPSLPLQQQQPQQGPFSSGGGGQESKSRGVSAATPLGDIPLLPRLPAGDFTTLLDIGSAAEPLPPPGSPTPSWSPSSEGFNVTPTSLWSRTTASPGTSSSDSSSIGSPSPFSPPSYGLPVLPSLPSSTSAAVQPPTTTTTTTTMAPLGPDEAEPGIQPGASAESELNWGSSTSLTPTPSDLIDESLLL